MSVRPCVGTRSRVSIDRRRGAVAAAAGLIGWLAVLAAAEAGPFASFVDSYDAGDAPAPGFTDPAVSLGPPERFTGESTPFPSVVSMFSPPFGTDEIVSIGEGGQLTVRFDPPVDDDPANPFGVDLIVFGNAGFILGDFANLTISDPASLFGADAAQVEVSSDGTTFFPVTPLAGALFPTQGWLDGGPFDPTPGLVPSNFLKPVNPALTLADFDGLTYADALALYDGSGGGTPIDIASSGLGSVSHVRIRVPDDANPNTSLTAEIDALANVPEPASLVLTVLAVLAVRPSGRRRIPEGRK